MREEKHFEIWMPQKQKIHETGRKWQFREKEIWWMAIGENVGTEINGKGNNFLRPILVVRKYGPKGFFGIPLSSQVHQGLWYADFETNGRKQCALLSQAGSFCSYRLYNFIAKISEEDFNKVLSKLRELIFKK